MNLDLDALQRAAESATPGPWESKGTYYRRPGSDESYMIVAANGDWLHSPGGDCGTMRNPEPYEGYGFSDANAAFIAAANPAAVLELLSRLGDRTKDVQELDERVIKLTSERDAVLADTMKLVDQIADLKTEVREWLCTACNTVYPGPPQQGISCVVCPKCGGDTGPRQTMEKRVALARAERAESALLADLTDAESTIIYENAREDGWCSHDVADKALHALFNRVMAARRAAQGGRHG